MVKDKKKPGLLRRLKIAYFMKVGKRRRYLRVPLRAKVTNVGTDLFEFFSSTNISIGGMFLKAEEPYAIGTLLKLEFSLPGEKEKIVVEGKVVRVVRYDPELKFDPGMGVQFTHLDGGSCNAIQNFVNNARTA